MRMVEQRFSGKVAIITGGAKGIGAATVRRFVSEGASVAFADLDAEHGQALAAELGEHVRYLPVDISTEAAWTQLVEAALALGGLDIVHVNAYMVKVQPAAELSLTDWTRQINVCLSQVYLAAHACMPHLVERRGVMICTSSVHAHAGFPGHPAYAASKGGICALVRQLAIDYGPAVRVNAVLPGSIETAAWRGATDADRHEVIERAPLRRMGRPEEIAAAITFLASNDASFITGAELLVDGGWLASSFSPTNRPA